MKKIPYLLYYEICEKSLKIRLDSIEKFVMLNDFTTSEENFLSENEEQFRELYAMRYFIWRSWRVPGMYATVITSRTFVVLLRWLCSRSSCGGETVNCYRAQKY